MSASFDFGAPDLFTAGTVGPPGQRTFFLQVREGPTVATLKVEKEQIAALADYLGKLLAKLTPVAPGQAADLVLLEPVTAAWAIGSIGVAYDEAHDQVVLLLQELREEGAEGDPATARFRVTRTQAAMFVERTQALVRAGRPNCRLCGRPMNPDGHVCARLNGHHLR